MTSHKKAMPQSPAQVLLETFVHPSGKSIIQYAKCMEVSYAQLKRAIKGKQMNTYFINQLSSLTLTPPRYWYYLQTNYLFYKFNLKPKQRDKILPIEPRVPNINYEKEFPGRILKMELAKAKGHTQRSIDRHLGAYLGAISHIITGGVKLNYQFAGRLAIAFNTSAVYWITLQTRYDLRQLINAGEILNPRIFKELSDYCSTDSEHLRQVNESNDQVLHPGRILLDRFIKPSNVSIINYRHLFCCPKRLFNSILKGRQEIPLPLIAKLSRVFNTKVNYWIDLQNKYYAYKAKQEIKGHVKTIKVQKATPILDESNPINMLFNNFLQPMNWEIDEFARHIGVSPDRLYSLRQQHIQIGFDLSNRIGEALNMEPRFWVHLQLEHNIKKYEAACHENNDMLLVGRDVSINS